MAMKIKRPTAKRVPKRPRKPPPLPIPDPQIEQPHVGAGRPWHQPTEQNRRTVESMATYGATQVEIAFLLNIHYQTLTYHYPRELKIGKIKANVKIGESIYTSALKGNTTAQIWWSKTQMGWKETTILDHRGVVGTFDYSKLSDEQLADLDLILSAAGRGVEPDEPEGGGGAP